MAQLRTTVVSAADAPYFPLLKGLVLSLRRGPLASGLGLSILDLGLEPDQAAWLTAQGARLVVPGWDVEFAGRDAVPSHYRAMSARPHLPRYFPGWDVYLWIDSDAWVQDDSVLAWFIRGAQGGKLAIVPEFDRGYWTMYKPPKLWGQNQQTFAWAFDLRTGYRLGRNPVLNVGVFALRGDAPHWNRWAETHRRILRRRRRKPPHLDNPFHFFLSEQTALNYVVFGEKLPATFLPAIGNWFCSKGDPMYDRERGMLVEPHEPHAPLGVVHLAGKGMKDRVWTLPTLQGDAVTCRLTYGEVSDLTA
jgi:hypothetical protein